MSTHKILIFLLLAGFVLSACVPGSGSQAELQDVEWVLQSIGKAIAEEPTVSSVTVTLRLGKDGTAAGFAGCNSYGGSYTINGGNIQFSELVSTLMACADEAVMDQEVAFLNALQSAGTYEVSVEQLTIFDASGEVSLVLTKGATPPASAEGDPASRVLVNLSALSSLSSGLNAVVSFLSQLSTAVPPTQLPPVSTVKPALPTPTAPVATAQPPAVTWPVETSEPGELLPSVSGKTYLDDRSTVTGLIASYFNAINRKEYLRAYGYWRNPIEALGPYEKYAQGYLETKWVEIRLGLIREGVAAGNIYFSVPVLIRAQTITGERQRFIGCFIVHQPQPAIQGIPPFMSMAIESASVKVVKTPGGGTALLASACDGSGHQGTPLRPAPKTNRTNTSAKNYLDDRSDAVQVIRSLVNAINRREYVRAYSYWEDAGISSEVESFDIFARGYADTRRVRLMVGAVLDDPGAGQLYYSVPVVMIARTTDGKTQTFAGCYVVHMPNPAMQMMLPFRPLSIRSAQVMQFPNNSDLDLLLARACGPLPPP